MYRKKAPNEKTRKKKKRERERSARFEQRRILFSFLGGKKRKWKRSKRGRLSSVLEPSTQSPSKQSKDREATAGTPYACAPMMEGGDECILLREKPGIRNIRLGRNKGNMSRLSPSSTRRSGVEGRCERTFTIYKVMVVWSQ